MQSFTELLNASIASYRKNINKVLGLSLVTGVALLLFQLIAPQLDPHHFNPSAILAAGLWAVVYIVVATLVTIAFYLMLDGKDGNVIDLLKLALPKLGAAIWVIILAGLLTGVAFMLLIVPGIIVSIWLTFVLQVLVLENKNATEALKASREYARGRWWAIFGRLFLLGLVLFAAVIVSSIVIAILSAFVGPMAKALNNVFSVFVLTPIATIFSYYLYRTAAHPTEAKEAIPAS